MRDITNDVKVTGCTWSSNRITLDDKVGPIDLYSNIEQVEDDVIINGVSFNKLLERVAALEEAMMDYQLLVAPTDDV
jgi:hypothetical protein